MKWLAYLFIIAIVWVIWEVVRRLIKSGYHVARGRRKPLEPKGPNSKEAIPALLSHSETQPLPEGAFAEERAGQCPLHGRGYCGVTVIGLYEPPQKMAFALSAAQEETFHGRLFVLGCNDCFDEAEKHESFVWKRENYRSHPVWASAQLVPDLLEDRIARVLTPWILFPEEVRDSKVLSESPLTKDEILGVLNAKVPRDDLHVAPEIPEKKAAAIIHETRLLSSEEVLGLIDCTVLGSAKNGMIFGLAGIYYHNSETAREPGRGRIMYVEFPDRRFRKKGLFSIDFDQGQSLDVSGCGVPKPIILEILQEIGSLVAAKTGSLAGGDKR